jgi:hypothetical protein
MVDLTQIYHDATGFHLSIVDGRDKYEFPLTNTNVAGLLASLSLMFSRGGFTVPAKEKARAIPFGVKRGPGQPRKAVSDDPKSSPTKPKRSLRIRPAEQYRVSGRRRVPSPKRK